MGAVFLFRRHKLLTTSILILITLPRKADLASLYNLANCRLMFFIFFEAFDPFKFVKFKDV